ncbi:MAG: helix-turn-helix domain-containing protein [Hyphomonadaceae bacterium]|jgi:transcriptional regulator with XRE-family HTH domain|nr:helix-turn-helix domain-containing protein [Hyphomonadaceae bacterium]
MSEDWGSENWGDLVKRYRLRHGLTQERMAGVIGVSQRTVSRWERGDDRPSLDLQRKLRDLGRAPPATLLQSLAYAVRHCPFPRALSRTPRLRLQALSEPAISKRPSVVGWIGRDLAPIACGILEEMLDDAALQRSIEAREIACVLTTTRSVLRTREHRRIGTYRTVITYFFHEGALYSDAVSDIAPFGTPLGYRAIAMDDVV